MTRRGAQLRKGNARSTMSTKISGQSSEVRTSSRSVRKVSYVESDGSEEIDEGKKKKPQKVQFTNFYVYTILVFELLHLDFYLYLTLILKLMLFPH